MSWSNPFARNEGRSTKTEEKLRFYVCRSNPFARNKGRCVKIEEKLRFYLSPLSHEMRVDRHKLKKNCDFTCAGATLSHEMTVDYQKLRKNCDFTCAGIARNKSRSSKIKKKNAILCVPEQFIDTYTQDIRYTCPGSSSDLLIFNGSNGVP